ncbi:hypothetical protein KY335_00925, partial [Candidatus Woesearchaeota archaeon]|nr:hypothetical protein [Candidatus Woesearchaeota archaeon]
EIAPEAMGEVGSQKTEEEIRREQLEQRLKDVEAAVNNEDMFACFKYSTDKKRASVSEIRKILSECGRCFHRIYHPEGKKEFVPQVIFVGDAHNAYDESSRRIVARLIQNGDYLLAEGLEMSEENNNFVLVNAAKEELAGALCTDHEVLYGILDSGNYYIHFNGMDCPEQEFKKLIRSYYAFATAYFVLKYRAPENPTEKQKKKIELLKLALPWMQRESDQYQYMREVDYFTPAIIKTVDKKKKNQIVFVHTGFLHQVTGWMLRRLEEKGISYVTFNFELGHVRQGQADMKKIATSHLEKKIEQAEGEGKESIENMLETTINVDPKDLAAHLYANFMYYNMFGTKDIDYTITIIENKKTGRIASIVSMDSKRTRERKIRYQLVSRKDDPYAQDILVEEVK